MLDYIVDPAPMRVWMSVGGMATLQSYGVEPPTAQDPPSAIWRRAAICSSDCRSRICAFWKAWN